jgi:hypothetical protein
MNTSLRLIFQREINTIICNVFFTIVYYAQFITTINFIIRYLGIVHNRKLSGREYMGMLSSLLSILVLIFSWDYFLTVPTDGNEFVMAYEYIEIFGGPNATNTDLGTCARGDLVYKYQLR